MERYRIAHHRKLNDDNTIGYEYRVERLLSPAFKKNQLEDEWTSMATFYDFVLAMNYLNSLQNKEEWPRIIYEKEF